jgi:hypothetical protein
MLFATEHHYIIASLHHDDFMLRLPLQKLGNRNILPIKIEIFFKIKTLPPYSVAKLTRVPVGPSSSLSLRE